MHRRVQTTSCTGLENEERRNSERTSAHVPWCGQHGRRGIWCQLRCIGECRQRVARATKTRNSERASAHVPWCAPARAARYLVSATMHRRVQTTSCTGLENEERRNSERAPSHVPWCGQHGRRGIRCQLRCIGECRQRVARASKTRSDEILSERPRMSRGAASTGGAVSGVSYDASASADNELRGPRKRGATKF